MVILRTTQTDRLMQYRRWRIQKKIGFGYGLALGIGFLGSMLGLVVADYYQGQGVKQLADANIQAQLLVELKAEIERSQYYGLRATAFKNGLTAQQTIQEFQKSLAEIKFLQTQITNFFNRNPAWTASDFSEIESLLTHTINRLERFQDLHLKNPEISKQIQAHEVDPLLEMQASIENLNDLVAIAQNQSRQAEIELENAQGIEKFVIVCSALIAVAVAGIIALQTTRSITKPLIYLNQIAQKAAQSSDFNLRVPVTTEDEIGTLSQSFNWLIKSVAERTQELQITAKTAEAQAQELRNTLKQLQETQLQLIQTEKMSSLGQLVAGVAHEINNPVNFIHGNLEYALEYVDVLFAILELYQKQEITTPEIEQLATEYDLDYIKTDLPRLLESMRVGTQRINSIVVSLRIFSRLDEAAVKAVDIHTGIDSTLMILQSRLKATSQRREIQVITEYSDLPEIECYAGQLNQVFMNILANAIDVLEETADSQKNLKIWIQTGRSHDNQIVIKIKDNGPGIPPETQTRLFDPFFTTKPIGKGTGLGLSISYRIVTEKHKGSLKCVSQIGQGTEFIISLPTQLSK
ncbi:MAG: sensor histidine kinase [Spirulinaceae cyanobacterium]